MVSHQRGNFRETENLLVCQIIASWPFMPWHSLFFVFLTERSKYKNFFLKKTVYYKESNNYWSDGPMKLLSSKCVPHFSGHKLFYLFYMVRFQVRVYISMLYYLTSLLLVVVSRNCFKMFPWQMFWWFVYFWRTSGNWLNWDIEEWKCIVKMVWSIDFHLRSLKPSVLFV